MRLLEDLGASSIFFTVTDFPTGFTFKSERIFFRVSEGLAEDSSEVCMARQSLSVASARVALASASATRSLSSEQTASSLDVDVRA
mmetsp:Transcript_26873/g.31690  ORF Transcript_26873/g.31690 Transcript_26873/m.31690 type:complete len:86 (-) Transcript_26873:313-570(-)